jgi:hypothetical protein
VRGGDADGGGGVDTDVEEDEFEADDKEAEDMVSMATVMGTTLCVAAPPSFAEKDEEGSLVSSAFDAILATTSSSDMLVAYSNRTRRDSEETAVPICRCSHHASCTNSHFNGAREFSGRR